VRHRARGTAVPTWTIIDHLAVPRRSAAARSVRLQLELLHETGWLARSRRHGVPTWELTEIGRERLLLELRTGRVAELPESPQHRAWRAARVAATQEIARFRRELQERLAQAASLLDAREPPASDVWLELADELRRASRRLASASYCLYEWAEPDDARADIDERTDDDADAQLDAGERAQRRARRAGRRNIGLWDDGAGR